MREQDEELLVRMVFQNPDAQLVGETVYEDIGFGLENRAVPPQQMPERVRSALAAVGLDVPPDRPVESLSGGQKQLLCIAAALATGAQVLLLDEPTSMLDPEAKRDVLRVMGKLHREGATIVWTTQAMDEIGTAERVIALQDGGVAFDGTPERFLYGDGAGSDGGETGAVVACPCLKVGLRLPYAVQVAQRLLRSGIMLSARPVDNGGLLKAVTDKWR
jgi:energy-coupling factor transport system ATP-binding protein